MSRIYCRIITEDHTSHTERQVIDFFLEKLKPFGAHDLSFTPLTPYYKIEGTGEMALSFFCEKSLTSIQSLFAEVWSSDTADEQIFCPHVIFLWISQ